MRRQKTDILIIGGGVVGVSIAYYAASRGASVRVIERGRIGHGSSYGNAGLLAASHCEPLPSPGVIGQGLRYLLQPEGPFYVKMKPDFELARWLWKFCRSCNEKHLHHSIGIFRKLSMESLQLHQELADMRRDGYEFARTGLLSLYSDDRAFEEKQAYAARMRSYGIEATVLSGDAVREEEPEVGSQIVGGLLYKMDGHLDPAAFVAWLAGEAQSQGIELVTETEVFWLEASHRKVTKVVTTHGDFEAEQVVIASGAWIPRLARHLGVRIPIRAAKGYSLTYKRPAGCPKIPLLFEDARVAVTPFADTIRFAGTLELGGMDTEIERLRIQAIQRQALRYLPRLGELRIKEIWAGLRPCTPDGLPIFGRLRPYLNVLIAGGHGTKGMLLGPVTGKYIAQMLAGESVGMVERSLRADRF